MNDDIPTLAAPRMTSTLDEMPQQTVTPQIMGTPMTVATRSLIFRPPGALPPRNHAAIMQNIRMRCGTWGQDYMYSWTARLKSGGRSLIEGLSVRGAMDLHQMFGNAQAGVVDVETNPTSWLFTAAYIDFETSAVTLRPYQQRRGQQTMGDAARQEDAAFQIGASKAVRNVIINALGPYARFMLEESKSGVAQWVTNNAEKATQYIEERLASEGLTMEQLEGRRGRRHNKWLARDYAESIMELRAIQERQASVEDIFGSDETSRSVTPIGTAPAAQPQPQAAQEQGMAQTPPPAPAAPMPAPGDPAGKLPFAVGVRRKLIQGGFNSLDEIAACTRESFKNTKGIGPGVMEAVDRVFSEQGLLFAGSSGNPLRAEPAPEPAPEPMPEPVQDEPVEQDPLQRPAPPAHAEVYGDQSEFE